MNEMISISHVVANDLVPIVIVEGHHRVVKVVMLNTMQCSMLQVVEKLVELVLHLGHETMAIMVRHIVIIVNISVHVEGVAIKIVVRGRIMVDIRVEISVVIGLPIVGELLNTVLIVVCSKMLRIVLTLVLIRVVVTHVMSALRLHVVILTVLFSFVVTMGADIGLMSWQVPIAHVEVSTWVMLAAMEHDLIMVKLLRVSVFIWCDICRMEGHCEV